MRSLNILLKYEYEVERLHETSFDLLFSVWVIYCEMSAVIFENDTALWVVDKFDFSRFDIFESNSWIH